MCILPSLACGSSVVRPLGQFGAQPGDLGLLGKAGGFTGCQGRLCNSMIGFVGKANGFASSKRHLRNSMIGSLGLKHRLLLFRYRQESICGWVPQTELVLTDHQPQSQCRAVELVPD